MIQFETEQTDELPFVEALCWRLLEEAVHSAKTGMHQAVVASVQDDLAVMRTVVLRRVDPAERKIYFHTDIRSQKVQDIHTLGKLSWLTYDPAYRTQLRMSGSTLVHHQNALCREHWDKTVHSSRRGYLQELRPGTPVDSFRDAFDEKRARVKYTMEESEAGFAYFAVVETTVDWMEWYYTHSLGNRRAVFCYDANGLASAQWQAP
jgi:pyridoxine/pyridoxamine 5'-phosphate oxidase